VYNSELKNWEEARKGSRKKENVGEVTQLEWKKEEKKKEEKGVSE
jgi:hypothetical protein